MEVYHTLGSGFLEAVYQEALEIESSTRNIPYTAQHEIPIIYKGRKLKKFYLVDMLAYGIREASPEYEAKIREN